MIMKNKIIYIVLIFSCALCFTNVKANNISLNFNYSKSYSDINLLDDEINDKNEINIKLLGDGDNDNTSNNSGNNSSKCSSLGTFGDDLQAIFNIFKIVAPLLTLALSSYDFVISITSKQAEGLQKSAKKFSTRLVLVVLLYLLPTILNVLLKLTIGGDTCVK